MWVTNIHADKVNQGVSLKTGHEISKLELYVKGEKWICWVIFE